MVNEAVLSVRSIFMLCLAVLMSSLSVVSAAPANDNYLGCFSVSQTSGDLDGLQEEGLASPFASLEMSVSTCLEYCPGLNFEYAGLQDGVQCFCGNVQPSEQMISVSNCQVECPADALQNCGGENAMDVYFIGVGTSVPPVSGDADSILTPFSWISASESYYETPSASEAGYFSGLSVVGGMVGTASMTAAFVFAFLIYRRVQRKRNPQPQHLAFSIQSMLDRREATPPSDLSRSGTAISSNWVHAVATLVNHASRPVSPYVEELSATHSRQFIKRQVELRRASTMTTRTTGMMQDIFLAEPRPWTAPWVDPKEGWRESSESLQDAKDYSQRLVVRNPDSNW